VIFSGVLALLFASRPFAWSGRRRIDGAIRCRQLRASTSRRTSGPTPFQRRGCGLSLDLVGPRGAFTEPRRPSDALIVTRRHARPASVPTDALFASSPAFAGVRLSPDEAATKPSSRRTPRRPTRKGRAGKSPRTPSVVSRTREPKPTSRISATFDSELSSAHRFAFSRLVPRVRRCFELPSG
jgi:hypothetical protein